MSERGRRGGFRAIGAVDASSIGLPPAKTRQLLLEHAWMRVAGEALARRAHAVAIRRGVLEIAVEDARWGAEIRTLLPRLAGALARRFPDLGVKRFRIEIAGSKASLPADVPHVEDADPTPSVVEDRARATPEEVTTGRLVEIARRYLERSEGSPQREE